VIDVAFGLVLLALLAAMAAIDWRRQIIPDELNAALALCGLAFRWLSDGGLPVAALLCGIATFLALWAFSAAFRRLRGMVGLGFGDVKMAGAAAIWISPWNLPILLLSACVAALVFAALAAVAGRSLGRLTRITFGPFIGLGLVITWMLERTNLPTLAPAIG
jgi:prepilin signal peptidase PulO-like enzyme (type II secretory pathway)